MLQAVVVTRAADRHAGPDREFAESFEVIVEAGPLPAVLTAVAEQLDQPRGRYSITVSDPFEAS